MSATTTHTKDAKQLESEISEANIISYLSSHPDFFRKNPKLLGDLWLPHKNNGATSLVERQVAVLRERSMSSRHKLSELLEIAKDNDTLFQNTQAFVLAILKASTLEEVYSITQHEIQHRFEVESSSILLLTNQVSQWSEQLNNQFIKPLDDAQKNITSILNSEKAFCSALRDTEINFIFNNSRNDIGSAAIASRTIEAGNTAQCRLLLCVAHSDPNHYSKHTGTLFLDYIADILQSLTQRFYR